jgi:uncharacterized membrane protein
MHVPFWALTVAYWLHMLATVIGIGGIAALSILVLPAAQRSLEPAAYAVFIERIQGRLDSIQWLCLAVLAGTGLVQLSASPNYHGFLSIQNRWAAAILVKHLVFLVMVGLSAYLSWGLLPRLRRLALQRIHMDQDALATQAVSLGRQEALYMRLNLVIGVVILALTAFARAS